LSFFSLFNMIGGVPPLPIGLRACHGMWSETAKNAKKAVVTQLPLGNPVLTLTGQLFASAAFRVQKLATTSVPPTGGSE
jgi:hypothetical protein